MGIDRPDVESVVHFEIPGSIEAYYQEIGRGGRDGRRADATLLWNYVDVRTREFLIDQSDDGFTRHGGEPIDAPDLAAREVKRDLDRRKLARMASGARAPALVYFHGGSRRQMLLGWNYRYYYRNAYAMNEYLASRGFVVLSVNYRSGIGYGMGSPRPAWAFTSWARWESV